MVKFYFLTLGFCLISFLSIAQWQSNPSGGIYYSGGNVGIGTPSPSAWFNPFPVFQINGPRPTLSLTPTVSNGLATIQFKGLTENAEFHLNFYDGESSALSIGSYQAEVEEVFRINGNGSVKFNGSTRIAKFLDIGEPNTTNYGAGLNIRNYLGANMHFAQSDWGASNGILFNAYTPGYRVNGDLTASGNAKYSDDAGTFNNGAGGIFYIGNGGVMDFMISPNSTGIHQTVDWGTPKIRIQRDGKIGFGANLPHAKLDIQSDVGTPAFRIQGGFPYGTYFLDAISFGSAGNVGYAFNTKNGGAVYNNVLTFIDDKIGVGTASHTPDAKLTVAGKVHAREVKVTAIAGADFVFESNYDLKPLSEVESYIDKNKHLPDIPSAYEMVKDGVSLGELNMKLLQKIEELTLYVIEQNKKIEAQGEQIKKLKEKDN